MTLNSRWNIIVCNGFMCVYVIKLMLDGFGVAVFEFLAKREFIYGNKWELHCYIIL